MSRRVEPLDKGLVTIRDPALLKPGELSFIRNAVYLPGSQALQRAKGPGRVWNGYSFRIGRGRT